MPRIKGTEDADTLEGGAGNDRILGLGGSDQLFGGAGNDELTGGAGSDLLTGGGGNDVFRFDARLFGSDVIADFGRGGDRVDVSGLNITDFKTLQMYLGENSSGDAQLVLYSNGEQEYVRFDGVELEDLSAKDFIFSSSKKDLVIKGGDDDALGGESDILFGANGDDKLFGKGGSDTLHGGGGDDTLFGGAGFDDLYGGPGKGKDVFKFDDTTVVSTVHDFGKGDKVDLRAFDLNWSELKGYLFNGPNGAYLRIPDDDGASAQVVVNDAELSKGDFLL